MANGFLMCREPSNVLLLYFIDDIINSTNYTPNHTRNVKRMFSIIKNLCKNDIELKAYTNLNLEKNIYIYRETFIKRKFYIIDEKYNIVINSNGHNY